MLNLASCVEHYSTIARKTTKIAAAEGFINKNYQTITFKIFTLQKITDPKKTLRVYIEGDGKSFVNRYTASRNPTPTSYFLIDLIKQDPHPNIIYIARPCQYLKDAKCERKYWTSDKFSKEIFYAIGEVLANFSKYKIELVGYSGGGEIARYFAAILNNVVNLRTIAGSLDSSEFSKIHNLPKLPKNFANRRIGEDYDYFNLHLGRVPQIHFVGEKDSIVPKTVAQSYAIKLLRTNCVKIIEVKNATHSKNWDKNWKKLLEERPACIEPLKKVK